MLNDLKRKLALFSYDKIAHEKVIPNLDENVSSIKVASALRATSAAPTYFPSIKLVDKNGRQLNFIDIGVVENYPIRTAFEFARATALSLKSPSNNNYKLVFIGTDESHLDIADELGRAQFVAGNGKNLLAVAPQNQGVEIAKREW